MNKTKSLSKILQKPRFFYRLALEVGYVNFVYRYLFRGLYKITNTSQKMKLFNDVEITLPSDSRFGTELFLKRSQLDWGSEALLLRFLESDKSFIDIGANIGYYSLLAAPISNTVYAFEPDPRVAKHLENNLSQFQNCYVIREALYSKLGTMKLNLHSSSELSSLVRTNLQDNQTVVVKLNTLDNLMLEYPSLKVSGIKTDAEGADLDILLGGKNLLMRDRPLVLSEAYPDSRLLRFIESIGFSCFCFAKPKDKFHLPAKFIKIEKQPVNYRIKMIFLVPSRLLPEFEKLAYDLKQ
ncbi:FkbM family methyltransferase [Baaleninema simplex]|uniref:FkbM family methyltransferase n=1 Tax=Baaleninema simplex TaxID=2862350 RepID=UPI0003466D13|nr:FkbM family methyltransferase [Baaleninema simplex]